MTEPLSFAKMLPGDTVRIGEVECRVVKRDPRARLSRCAGRRGGTTTAASSTRPRTSTTPRAPCSCGARGSRDRPELPSLSGREVVIVREPDQPRKRRGVIRGQAVAVHVGEEAGRPVIQAAAPHFSRLRQRLEVACQRWLERQYTARLVSGEWIPLPKDCDCRDEVHTGPHWRHLDALAKRLKEPLRARAETGSAEVALEYALEELARLRDKRREMERRGIVEIWRPAAEVDCER